MALGRVGRTVLFRTGAQLAVGAAAVVTSCDVRDVYLVPRGAPVVADASSPSPPDAAPPSIDAPMWHFDAGSRDGGSLACAVDSHHPEPQALGIYIMVNQSRAMGPSWSPVVDALTGFITESGTLPNVSAGIQYFARTPTPPPLDLAAQVCLASTYSVPDVPIALLPGNEPALVQSLATHGPFSLEQLLAGIAGALVFYDDSPADAALEGAIVGARAWHVAHEPENPRAAVLLVTSAVPNSSTSPTCRATLDAAIAAATEGLSGVPSVATYVLGVGEQLGDLDEIAAAGGTTRAHLVQSGTPAQITAQILEQIEGVRSVALPCEFAVDPDFLAENRANVDLVEPGGTVHILRVPESDATASAGCGGTISGWYSVAPGTVHLCPDTCQRVRSSPNASLEVVYGCPTAVAQ